MHLPGTSALAFASLITALGSPAWAQNAPIVTLSGGYASIGEADLQMPGFYVEGERRLTRMISAVGQVHRATGSGEGYFSTIAWTDLFAGGGVRVSGRPAPWWRRHLHAEPLLGIPSRRRSAVLPRRAPERPRGAGRGRPHRPAIEAHAADDALRSPDT